LGPLDQQVTLKLRNDREHTHRHLPGRTGQIAATKLEAMNPDTHAGQFGDCGGHVDGTTPKAI
jgi:hypothetical protein